ncbi:MAG: hypothetical protein ACD_37C00083G0001 [uncultured bacterium]|nr:MAG: hypothetical protein ACD_37C00083G0001 [uncultured bacterium]
MRYNEAIPCGRGEMVDTQGLGPCAVKSMGVRVLSSAPNEIKNQVSKIKNVFEI